MVGFEHAYDFYEFVNTSNTTNPLARVDYETIGLELVVSTIKWKMFGPMYSGVTPKSAPCAIPRIVPTLLPTLTPSRALKICYLCMKF